MPQRSAGGIAPAAWVALAAIALAPSAFSLHLLSFLQAKELVYAPALIAIALLGVRGGAAGAPPRWLLALGAFIVAMALLAVATGAPHFSPVEKCFRALLVIGFVAAALHALPGEDLLLYLRRALILSGVCVAALGLLQFVNAIPFLLPVFPSYDQPMYSVFGNRDLLGGYLAIVLPIAIGRVLAGELRERRSALVAVAVMALTLLLSQSRTAWLAAALGVGVCLFLAERRALATLPEEVAQRHRRRIRVLVILAALAVALTPVWWFPRLAQTFSVGDAGGNLRQWFYAGTWDMIRAHPWPGVGFGRYGFASPVHMGAVLRAPGGAEYAHNQLFVDHAHSDPFEALAELGAIGVALLTAAACFTLRHVRVRRGAQAEASGLLALLVFAAFNPCLLSAAHAVAGLLCVHLVLEQKSTTRLVRSWALLVVSGVIVAGWMFFTLAPSVLTARAEEAWRNADSAAGAHTQESHRSIYESFARIATRFGGPPHLYEDAAAAALEYVTVDPTALDAAMRALLTDAARETDTGNFHQTLAGIFRAAGDTARAQEEFEKVQERWPTP